MLQFLVRRLIVAILVAATVMTLAFILTRLSGDLAISIAGPNATQADVEAVRKAYGLDRPLTVQFFDWVGRAATGDLGESYFFKTKVSRLIGERMPITITLGLTGLWDLFAGRIYSANQVPRGKPFPDLFLHAALDMNVQPFDCIVVEDSVPGVQAARSAGMRALAYAGEPYANPAALKQAGGEVFEAMKKLPALVLT